MFNFGQFRKNQIEDYLSSLTYKLETIKKPSDISSAIVFNDKYITFQNGEGLSSKENGKQNSYYIRFRIPKTGKTQMITVKLINTNKKVDNIQNLGTIEINPGVDYSSFELVITPNQFYNQIKFELNRENEDYTKKNEDGTYGRVLSIAIENFSKIYNVLDYLTTIDEKIKSLKQIGIQSVPGLGMCINGEYIRVGRSGLYELDNGVNVNFIGFIQEKEDNDYFLLDYKY